MSGPAGDAHVPPKKNKNTRGLQSGFSGGGALWNSNKLGAAEVLSMPWYAAQKQADPAQVQQAPAQIQQAPAQIQQAPAQIQQAPTEKQQFEYKAKMDQGDLGIREMDKKKEVIEMEMRAGQLKAEQKERESSKSMAGVGQSTVGTNPSTVGMNPSTVGMDQSTVGTEQSTADTEPTAMAGSMSMNQTMPEAQWTAPTA